MTAEIKPASEPGDGAPACDWSKIMRLTGESMRDDTGRTTYQDAGDDVSGWVVIDGERLAFTGRQSADGVVRAVLPRGLGLLVIYPDGRQVITGASAVDAADYSRLHLGVPRG